MSQSEFMALIQSGSRFNINEIMGEFNVARNTARAWVNKPGVSQIPGVWPPTYTHVKHLGGIITETSVGKIEKAVSQQKLSRAENAVIAAVPYVKEVGQQVTHPDFSKALEVQYEKAVNKPRDYKVEEMFANASSVDDIHVIAIRCWAMLTLCQYQLDRYKKNGEPNNGE